jgi:hypothetical protein
MSSRDRVSARAAGSRRPNSALPMALECSGLMSLLRAE